jgi:hypothetical protein
MDQSGSDAASREQTAGAESDKEESPPPGSDFAHLEKVMARGDDPRAERIGRLVGLIAMGLENAPRPWALTGANDFSAVACFTRAFRQVLAAMNLTLFGYYSEVGTVLRGAYESAGLGRYLAHELSSADRWLRKGDTWIKDKLVRDWFGDEDGAYAKQYSVLSTAAHPTAQSCLPLVEPTGSTYRARLLTEFDEAWFGQCLDWIQMTALWACFAFRNAAVSEAAIPGEWRKELTTLANEIAPGNDWSHLERDWEAEQEKWERLAERVQSVADLEALLKEHPGSWGNLTDDASD